MTVRDIFTATILVSYVVGIISLIMSYVVFTGTGILIAMNANMINNNGIQQMPAINTLLQNSQSFSLVFPDLAGFMVVILITETIILSFFIKAHPLASVLAILMLFVYAGASFFVSNVLVSIARMSVWAPIIASANWLTFIWINAPVILVIAGLVDIAAAWVSANR